MTPHTSLNSFWLLSINVHKLIFRVISHSRVKMYFLLTFSGPNSACRGAIDPKPPPIDLSVFIIFYKNDGMVVGVVLRPRGCEKCISGVSLSINDESRNYCFFDLAPRVGVQSSRNHRRSICHYLCYIMAVVGWSGGSAFGLWIPKTCILEFLRSDCTISVIAS